jgi:hypothetical protein
MAVPFSAQSGRSPIFEGCCCDETRGVAVKAHRELVALDTMLFDQLDGIFENVFSATVTGVQRRDLSDLATRSCTKFGRDLTPAYQKPQPSA